MTLRFRFPIIWAAAVIPALSLAAQPEPAVGVTPVADVWSRPLAAGEKPSDSLRQTQVLFGEKVLIRASSGPWVRIEAVEQPTFRQHHQWEGYPGWMLSGQLGPSLATSGKTWTSVETLLRFAESIIGTPYRWGGLDSRKGLDCSGLIHLTYRVNGLTIPRDAHEQWMKAKPIKRKELKPGDLIFSAKAEDPKKITHVALYAGDGQIIEAPQTGLAVRKIFFREKYGKALEEVESTDRVGERVIYFGSYLH